MIPAPRWMRESADEIPGIAVIARQLASSSSVTMFIDSIRVYPDRIYLRIGLKFRDLESWREAAIDPSILTAPETFRATIRYHDGETILTASYSSIESTRVTAEAISSNVPGSLVPVNTEGAGLQWYVDYLFWPMPAEDIVFSAEFPRLGLARGDWLLSRSVVAECLAVGSQYARARKAAEEDGCIIASKLDGMAEIAGRLAHLGARVEFGNAKFGWEPTVLVPLNEKDVLSIYEILPGDPVNVTISGRQADCYLLEISGDPGTQIIALRSDVTRAAEIIIAGLHNGYRGT